MAEFSIYCNAGSKGRGRGVFFGLYPLPVQHGFTSPMEGYEFVGQMSASEFILADFHYYLYYNPRIGDAIQLMQLT